MKSTFYTAAILLPVFLLLPHLTYAHNGAVAIAVPVAGIVIDGDLSDWPQDLTRYPIALVGTGSNAHDPQDLQASFRIGYSAEEGALFVGIEVQDESTIIDSSVTRNWDTEDGCEIFIDWVHGDSSVARQHVLRGNGIGPGLQEGKKLLVHWRREGERHQYEWRLELDEAKERRYWTAVPSASMSPSATRMRTTPFRG
ncbi:MAG: hypothetical protein HN404_11110 [Gemmatimonadetes bacterium]|jgi:hypothetical protein|nr:hypothetical protein [Gemmatimonadota bacterium]